MLIEERIRKLRKTNETTQKKLAETIDVANLTTSSMENSESKPTTTNLFMLTSILDAGVTCLMEKSNDFVAANRTITKEKKHNEIKCPL